MLRLPRRRFRAHMEPGFVAMRDGVRLATRHLWPVGGDSTRGTILIRTPYGVQGPNSFMGICGRLLAESGYHVVLQDVRGRYESEGRFEPFRNEKKDGRDTVEWILEQPWAAGRPIGLFGASYLSYTAWCVLSEMPEHVGAIVSMIGCGDLYGVFYSGGGLSFQNTLEWGISVGDREAVPPRTIDLERGWAHRPTREADRVALRTVGWVRDWIDHPRQDAYWDELTAELPEKIPPVLSIAGLYDFFLQEQIAQYEKLIAKSNEGEAPSHRLIVGPWAHGVSAGWKWWRHGFSGLALREAIAHFDRHLSEGAEPTSDTRVRYFVPGQENWKTADSWPPPSTEIQRLFLNAQDGKGQLCWEEPQAEAPSLHFDHDPNDPTPSIGGALFGWKAGVKDQRPLESRPDVLSYESATLEKDLTLTGPIYVSLSVETNVEDIDLAVTLIDVLPNGRAENVCHGLQRARWRDLGRRETEPVFIEPGVVTRIQIDLGHAVRTFRKGHRLRLNISGSSFPLFDRNPACRVSPEKAKPSDFLKSRQVLHHGHEQRSWIDCLIQSDSSETS